MNSIITYTSTLSSGLMAWLQDYAERNEMTKRAIIERALEAFRREAKRKEFEEGFKRMAKDPDILEWAEWGMGNYHEQLKRLES